MSRSPREHEWEPRAFRICTAGWLVGWYLKVVFYGPYLLSETFACRVQWEGFWPALAAPEVTAVAFLLPLVGFVALIRPSPPLRRLTAAAFVVSSLAFLLHINTFHDASWVSAFWVALWLSWLAFRKPVEQARDAFHARLLAQCIVAMLFLGGFTGKLHADYWNGAALFHVFGETRPVWPWPWLREVLAEGQLRALTLWLSRGIVVSEGLLSLLPLLPYRWACVVTVGAVAGMMLLTDYLLLSVFASVVGLMIALWRLPASQAGE